MSSARGWRALPADSGSDDGGRAFRDLDERAAEASTELVPLADPLLRLGPERSAVEVEREVVLVVQPRANGPSVTSAWNWIPQAASPRRYAWLHRALRASSSAAVGTSYV